MTVYLAVSLNSKLSSLNLSNVFFNNMNILIIGSGGREHAIIWKLKETSKDGNFFCIPGNGGVSKIAKCVDFEPTDVKKITKWALENKIDLTVVGPEGALAAGIVDEFQKNGLKIFGPDEKAAKLESSKIFAKNFMEKYNIPTAKYEVFDNYESAVSYLSTLSPVKSGTQLSTVVKADGLCAGKGVFVCESKEESVYALNKLLKEKIFGKSSERIIIEEKLEGGEVSIMAFCDGENILPLLPSQDHKRVFDNDKGPNTGGMGAYAPAENIVDMKVVEKEIFFNFLRGVKNEGLNFKGIIYVGIISTKNGPKVLEFNVRFGDPETQSVLPLMKSNLAEILLSTIEGKLNKIKLEWYNKKAVCVVLTSVGYPGTFEMDKKISGLEKFESSSTLLHNTIVFHAATKVFNDAFYTSGGRVLNVVSLSDTLDSARKKVYEDIQKIKFDNMHYRRDIGKRIANSE